MLLGIMGFIEKYLPFLLTDSSQTHHKKSHHEIEKELAKKTVDERTSMAAARRANPDVLDVLADDKDIGVRRAVARNKANHGKTNVKLSYDEDDDVRLILAHRLAKLLPHLSKDEQSEIYRLTVKALGVLAEDKVTTIRVALSSSLKDVAKIPPKIARKLAEDIEREVSEPILRFGVALPDEVLLDIIKSQPMGWKVNTIAQRKEISAKITEIIIQSENIEAGKTVIDNDGADITEDTTKIIKEKSTHIPEWDRAMLRRKQFPRQVKRQLSVIVDNTIRKFLKSQKQLDSSVTHDIIDTTRRRIEWAEDEKREETDHEKLRRLVRENKLNEETILDALAWSEYKFVSRALSHLAKIHPDIVDKMFAMNSAKACVALCWRAGISMRSAVKIQQHIGKIPHHKILLPRGGEDYPLSDEDMLWQLEFYGVENTPKK